MLELRDRGVYHFSIMMRTPFAGQTVIARSSTGGFDLFALEEWSTLADPRIRVDPNGRILYHGRPTGYWSDILLDSGDTVDERD